MSRQSVSNPLRACSAKTINLFSPRAHDLSDFRDGTDRPTLARMAHAVNCREGQSAPPCAAHAGLRICPASLLISSFRSASSVLPAPQEMAFDSRHIELPAGMFTVSAEL